MWRVSGGDHDQADNEALGGRAVVGSAAGGIGADAAAVAAPAATEAHARRFAQMFVTLMQGSLLLGAAENPGARAVAEGFCATRLDADSGWGAVFGASGAGLDVEGIVDRAWVE